TVPVDITRTIWNSLEDITVPMDVPMTSKWAKTWYIFQHQVT
ncbi:7669_t:CDS:2, partial [Dentiscutata erythropus]